MNLVIVHHHLNHGGVTQVILNHLRSLKACDADQQFGRIVVLHGGRTSGWPQAGEPALQRVELHGVSQLDYDDLNVPAAEAPYAATQQALLQLGLPPESTLLHVHNHSLGKTVAWPAALARLAQDGYRLLLQLHDFAEDFRPENYRRQIGFYDQSTPSTGLREVYFQAPHVNYAVLNSRDRAILTAAGIQPERLHWLPNPVQPFPPLPPRDDARRKLQDLFDVSPDDPYYLYPVRGIRRKNVGEMLLWSALTRQPATFAITLAPVNPVELAPYQKWQQLAQQLRLPCRFDVGGEGKLTFHENLAAADAILSTSVAEGFGMVFLEAWLAGQMLVGRDLPEISTDFQKAGLRLESLSPALLIPLRWPLDGREVISETAYRQQVEQMFAQLLTAFGLSPVSSAKVQDQIDTLLEAGWIDFARLPLRHQREVIAQVASDDNLAAAIRERNHAALSPLTGDRAEQAATIQINAQIALTRFGLAGTGRRLAEIYALLMQQEPGETEPLAAADEILRQFIDLKRLHPVRLENA